MCTTHMANLALHSTQLWCYMQHMVTRKLNVQRKHVLARCVPCISTAMQALLLMALPKL